MRVFIALLLSISVLPVHACTGILLKSKDNACIYARTLEFGIDLQSKVLFVPRNFAFAAASPHSSIVGLQWRSRHAVVGINIFDSTNFVDGINEQGLAGGIFYFPGFAQYQSVTQQQYAQSLPAWQLLTWVLTQCASVAEVKNTVPTLWVTDVPFTGAGPSLPQSMQHAPIHLIVHDAQGNSVVIEYVKGILQLHDNPLGVITNAPDFQWHLTNLRNYINLSPTNASTKTMAKMHFEPLGMGSGMHGLPGDFTPPSRFVRAVTYTQAAPVMSKAQEAVKQAFHILHNFDIPQGVVRDANGAFDYTTWTSACDMQNKIYYWRPYNNFQLKKVTLAHMNVTAKEVRTFPLEHVEEIIEIQ